MSKTGKRILSLLLIFTMLGSLAACGGKNDSAANAAAKEHVFRAESIPISVERKISNTRTVCRVGDRLYLLCMNWGETGQENFLLTMNLDGSDTQVIDLEIESKQSDSNGSMITDAVARMPVVEDSEEETEETSEETQEETGETTETAPGETEREPEETP